MTVRDVNEEVEKVKDTLQKVLLIIADSSFSPPEKRDLKEKMDRYLYDYIRHLEDYEVVPS